MNTSKAIVLLRHTVLAVSLALMTWLPVVPTGAADYPASEATRTPSVEEISSVAAGSVEDTLKACMARIPKVASAGQRMVAERSCDRDEMERKPVQAVPGR